MVPKVDRYREMKGRIRKKWDKESTYNLGVFKLLGPDQLHFRIFEALSEAIAKLLSLKSDGE